MEAQPVETAAIVETTTAAVVAPAQAATVVEPAAEVIPPVTDAPASKYDADITHEGVKYGEHEVSVTIPKDVANFSAEKGLDAEAISKELYSSEDFTLSEETMESLYEAFGKWQVDAYLSGLKAKNDMSLGQHKAQQEARTVAETKAWEATLEVMGGEDRWEDMSSYAANTLSDEEFNEFNSVMETGSLRMQQLMIKDLYNRFETAGKPPAGEPVILDLEEGTTSGDKTLVNQPLSASEYLELLRSGKYKEAPEKYDKLRRAGMAKGL